MEELPPLRLDVTPHDPDDGDDTHLADPEPPRRARLVFRAALVVAAVAALVFAITTVVNSRVEASRNAAEADEVNLIVGQVDTFSAKQSDDAVTATLAVEFYNAGPHDVTVISAVPTGWELAADSPEVDKVVEPGVWARLETNVTASCDGSGSEMPDTFDVVVEPSSGNRHELTLTRKIDNYGPSTDPCEIAEYGADAMEVWVFVEKVVPGSIQDESLVLSLDLKVESAIPVGSTFTLTDITPDVPGFAIDAPELPVELGSGGEPTPVETVWRVTDCEAIGTTSDQDPWLNAELESDDADVSPRVDGGIWLLPDGAMALGRLVGEVC